MHSERFISRLIYTSQTLTDVLQTHKGAPSTGHTGTAVTSNI